MSKRIQVLGMEIDNHTLREMMFLLDEYTNSDGLNVVGVLTTEILMAASEQENVEQMLKDMNMHVIADVAILEVQKELYEQQVKDIQRCELEELFLNMLIRKKKTVYWISEAEHDLEVLQEYMQEHYPKLNIAGCYTKRITEEEIESLINDINRVAPDVIFMQITSPAQQAYLLQYRNQLNAKLCICLSYRVRSKYWSPNKNSKIKTLIDQTMFKRKAMRYAMDKQE